MLTIERLKSLLFYEPATGEFIYLTRRGQCVAGQVAGKINAAGYRRVSIDRQLYQAHRLAWFYVHGEWPTSPIDHINLIKRDNRIENLRLASHSENNANTHISSRNSSGFKGVTWHGGCGKWQSSIKINGRNIHLGLFLSPELAHAAYCGAAKALYGRFARAA